MRARLAHGVLFVAFLWILPACEDDPVVERHYFPESPHTQVPGDYATIQEALDEAENGDIIEVAPGTYYEALVFPPVWVTLRSKSGDPYDTILDGSQNGEEVVLVDFPENATSPRTLQGFTLTNSHGRAVSVSFEANDGNHQIENCRFVNNGPYGAIRSTGAFLTVVDCEFIDNEGYGFGAAILTGGNTLVGNCVFRNNDAIPFQTITLTQGGAIHAQSMGGREGSILEVRDCTFEGNHCTDYGGAIQVTANFVATIADNVFMGNVADVCAGGIYVVGAGDYTTTIENNLFVGENSPQAAAIGIHWATGTVVRNNTIVGSLRGEGIRAEDADDYTIEKNIVAFGQSWGITNSYSSTPPTFVMSCNNSFGNPFGNYNSDEEPPGDNLATNPLFCDSESGNYNLLPSSPCRPTGNACEALIGAFDGDCAGAAP
jgi:predicted outer membrane repeat protein